MRRSHALGVLGLALGLSGCAGTAQRVVTGPTVCEPGGPMLASATPCPIHRPGGAAPASGPRCPIHGTLLVAPAPVATGRCTIHQRGVPTAVASRASAPSLPPPETASLPPMRAVRYLTMSDEPWDYTLPDPLGVRTPGTDAWKEASGAAPRPGDGETAPAMAATTAAPPRRDRVVPTSAEAVATRPGGPLLDVRGSGSPAGAIALEYESDPSLAGRPRASSPTAPGGRAERWPSWVSELAFPARDPEARRASQPVPSPSPSQPRRVPIVVRLWNRLRGTSDAGPGSVGGEAGHLAEGGK
jgi:hypothetical protein